MTPPAPPEELKRHAPLRYDIRSFGVDIRDTAPNFRRKALATVGRLGSLGNPSARPQFFERITRGKAANSIDVFRQVPRQQEAVVQGQVAHDALHHVADERRAVAAYRVIEARRIYESVRLVDVGEE